MGTDSMIPVPAPLDKYHTCVRHVPSWVPTTRVLKYPWVFMGTHEFLNLFLFFVQIITFF